MFLVTQNNIKQMVVRRLHCTNKGDWTETGTDASTNDCFQPLSIVSGGAPSCTRCVAQNWPLWRLLAVSDATQC